MPELLKHDGSLGPQKSQARVRPFLERGQAVAKGVGNDGGPEDSLLV